MSRTTEPTASGAAHRRRLRAYVLVATACAMAWCTMLVGLVSFPGQDAPRRVDVVMVLGPAWSERVAMGIALVEAGYADTLVVSTGQDGARSPDAIYVCTQPQAFEVLCLSPEPYTTQGEARDLARLAEQHAWSSAIVVTMRPHTSRARMLFERCLDIELAFVDDAREIEPWRWARQYAYEAGAWAKAGLTFDC